MVGLLTIPWTMTAELFPTEIREFAHAISYSIANILMFTAVQSYRQLVSIFGGSHGIQWFFAGVSIGAAVYVWLLVSILVLALRAIAHIWLALFTIIETFQLPETHDKKLSEIEDYFHNNFLACGAEARTKKLKQQKAQAALLKPTDKLKTAQIA